MVLHAEYIRDSAEGFYGKVGRIVTIAQVVTIATPMTFDTVAVSRLRGGEAGLHGEGGRAHGRQFGAACSWLTRQEEA
jgi:hypothetical protein